MVGRHFCKFLGTDLTTKIDLQASQDGCSELTTRT